MWGHTGHWTLLDCETVGGSAGAIRAWGMLGGTPRVGGGTGCEDEEDDDDEEVAGTSRDSDSASSTCRGANRLLLENG